MLRMKALFPIGRLLFVMSLHEFPLNDDDQSYAGEERWWKETWENGNQRQEDRKDTFQLRRK